MSPSNYAFERSGSLSSLARGRRGGQFAPAARWKRWRPAVQRERYTALFISR
jgi:hypothetical protein